MQTVKMLLISVVLPALIIGCSDFGPVQKGETANITHGTMVIVKNLQLVKNVDREFAYNAQCHVKPPGVLVALGDDGLGYGHILVEYKIEGTLTGKECPPGTLFFMGFDEFRSFQSRARRQQMADAREKAIVMRLTSQ